MAVIGLYAAVFAPINIPRWPLDVDLDLGRDKDGMKCCLEWLRANESLFELGMIFAGIINLDDLAAVIFVARLGIVLRLVAMMVGKGLSVEKFS